MNHKSIFWGGLIAATLLVTSVSRAALVNQGKTTRDTATGLVWLDVTASQSRAYNDVSANLAAGGDFAGYRYATEAEVLRFWNDAGFTDTSFNDPAYPASGNPAAVRSLQALIGITQPGNGNLLGDATFAINGDAWSSPGTRRFTLIAPGISRLDWGGLLDSASVGNFGSYLVQVPEPTAMAGVLFAAGIVAVGSKRHSPRK